MIYINNEKQQIQISSLKESKKYTCLYLVQERECKSGRRNVCFDYCSWKFSVCLLLHGELMYNGTDGVQGLGYDTEQSVQCTWANSGIDSVSDRYFSLFLGICSLLE
jgi:hypothetical protein